jgi:hypothetical protein
VKARLIPALVVASIALAIGASAAARSGGQAPAPVFRFHTDGFWLNLHHFLYVLGRADAQMPDRQRRAVAGAPADQARGLGALAEDQRLEWGAAVRAYAAGMSRKDLVFDRDAFTATALLRHMAPDAADSALTIEPALASVLRRAAPAYRRAWWPAHRAANRERAAELQSLVDRHGDAVLPVVTRAYREPWPADGYPVNMSAYTNWAGAYSTSGQLLVVSSLDPGTTGTQGLEIIFHEAMHQWDEAIQARLERLVTQGTPPPDDLLLHALIFYTAGEAVRRAVPGHQPYAEVNGLWKQKGLGALKPALDSAWQPYLEGAGTLDDALTALLKSAAR